MRTLTPLLFLLLSAAPASVTPEFDLLLINGRIIDGTGAAWFRGDLGIKGEQIAAMGQLRRRSASRTIDVADRAIAPGFIDMLGQSELYVLIDNRVESKVRQGITTEITGEGQSAAPINAALIAEQQTWLDKFRLQIDWKDFTGYFARLEKNKSTVNLGTFVGAASVRAMVLGMNDVQPTPAQLSEMERLVDVAMQQGALGVSAALIYPPGSYAKTPELIALARVAARNGGVYATHIRGEGDNVLQALEEAFTIGREARVPVELWHLKASEKKNWGRMKELVAAIEKARASGVDVTADMYPYPAAMNGLIASVPEWAQAGGIDATIKRLRDPEQRRKIKQEL